ATGARRKIAGKKIEKRAFARAVRTDHRMHLAHIARERYFADRRQAAELARQPASLQDRIRHWPLSGARSDRSRRASTTPPARWRCPSATASACPYSVPLPSAAIEGRVRAAASRQRR